MFTPSGSPPPSPAAINKLCSVLDLEALTNKGDDSFSSFLITRRPGTMSPADVGLKRKIWMMIEAMDIFFIPLHDHPGMTVFSKVLYGSLPVRAYDWVEPPQESKEPNYFPVRLAKLAVDKVLTAPCGASILYPRNGGNLHYFTAVTPCAVLDILTPPYREDAGRKCTYYRDYPYTAFATVNRIKIDDGEYAWLAETEPDNL
ncbi:hypothetical protein ACE6H2_028210 [Prunus campanulata]